MFGAKQRTSPAPRNRAVSTAGFEISRAVICEQSSASTKISGRERWALGGHFPHLEGAVFSQFKLHRGPSKIWLSRNEGGSTIMAAMEIMEDPDLKIAAARPPKKPSNELA